MKNHLSMDGSIGAGRLFSPGGMLKLVASARSGELLMVELALFDV